MEAPFMRRGPWNHTWGEDLANARRYAGLSAPAGRIRVRAVWEEGMRMRHVHSQHQLPSIREG